MHLSWDAVETAGRLAFKAYRFKQFKGSLIELLDAAEKFIKLNAKRGWKKRPTDRVNYSDYPERAVASDRHNPTLADMFALMDYMERKGSGLGLMLDAYAKEVPNPRQLEPKFYSSSGSFHVVLPNLNFDVTQGVTRGDAQGGTQGVTQDVTQGVTQAGLSPLDLKIVEHIRKHPNPTEELAKRLGCVPMTIKRHLAKLPNVRYVGHGYSGHWEVDWLPHESFQVRPPQN